MALKQSALMYSSVDHGLSPVPVAQLLFDLSSH